MKTKRAIFASGGGTKLIAIISAFFTLVYKRDYKFKLAGGVSAGAIVMWCYIGGKMTVLQGIQLALNVKISTFLSNNPYGIIGAFRLIYGLICSLPYLNKYTKDRYYISKMTPLKKNMEKIVSKQMFNNYVSSKETPDLYVLAVSKMGKITYWNLKHLDYYTAIKAVLASCSICPAVEGVEINGKIYFDGGHRDHSPGVTLLKNIGNNYNLTEVVSIFSRPKNTISLQQEPNMKNFIKALFNFVIPVFNLEITSNDEAREADWCKDRNIKYTPIHIAKFTNDVYDTNSESMKKGKEIGENAVYSQYDYAIK